MAAESAALPILLMSRPGCHLCDLALETLAALLAERAGAGLASPAVVEVNIEDDASTRERYGTSIPVLVLGSHELPLAKDAGSMRLFLATALDQPAAAGG